MTFVPTVYADHDSLAQMRADCTACAAQSAFSRPVIDVDAVEAGAPSIRFEDFQQRSLKPEITVSAAAQHLAARLHLHLD